MYYHNHVLNFTHELIVVQILYKMTNIEHTQMLGITPISDQTDRAGVYWVK